MRLLLSLKRLSISSEHNICILQEKDTEKQKEALTLLTTLRSNVEIRVGSAQSEAEKASTDLEGRVHVQQLGEKTADRSALCKVRR